MPLYVVATPLGNLADISNRALRTLTEAELILAEDTSHSIRLLKAYNIKTPLKRYDAYKEKKLPEDARLLSLIKKDASIAIISDAGSPLISDPGRTIVQLAQDMSMRVIPIPGPCAAIAALSISGFEAGSFFFGGYLPRTGAARRACLEQYRSSYETSVFYEAPHRLRKSLEDLCKVWGSDRKLVLARELTKIHESVFIGTIGEINRIVNEKKVQGEMVLVLEGINTKKDTWNQEDERTLKLLLNELPLKLAVEVAARIRCKKKNVFYRQALAMQKESVI